MSTVGVRSLGSSVKAPVKGTNTNGLSMKCRQTNKFRDRSSSTAQISFQRIGEVMEVDKVIGLDPRTKNVL